MKIIICGWCQKPFSPKNRIYTRKCCCRSHGQKFATKLGNKSTLFKKGQSSWNKGLPKEKNPLYGRKHSKERIEKTRQSIKKHFDLFGRKTPKLEALRKSKKYKEWRNTIFKRDNWTCQKCKARNRKGKKIILHADHIKPFAKYPKLRFKTKNGRTLCDKCHKKTKTYGLHK
jgi:hypothetical protein